MPIVCGNCGSENRSNAKFCIGCAGRLPGFAPSGAAALQPEETRPGRTASQPVLPPVLEPSFAAGSRAPETRRGVPSEAPSSEGAITSFWLNLGLVSLTMIIAFVAWCVYVLHHGTAPWAQIERMFASTPAARQTEPVARTDAPETKAAAPTVLPASTVPPVAPAAPTPTAAPASSTATVAAPSTASSAAALASPAAALGLGLGSGLPPKTQTASVINPSSKSTSQRSRRAQRDEEPDGSLAYQLPSPQPRTYPDPGPPIAPGPGPQYSWVRPSQRVADDPGPPVAIGPGPRYGYEVRSEASAPSSVPSGDPGPPIAVGPGPRYDYSTPGSRR